MSDHRPGSPEVGLVGDADFVGGVGRSVVYSGTSFPELRGRRGRVLDWIDNALVFVAFDPTPEGRVLTYRLPATDVREP